MQRIARSADPGPAVLPATRSPDVRAPLIGEKDIGASIEPLSVPLQLPGTFGKRGEVGIVSHDHEYVEVFRIRF